MSLLAWSMFLILGSGPSSPASDPRCIQAPTWCDPKMVALRIADASGEMEVRAEDGAPIFWKRHGWAGRVQVIAKRLGEGRVRLQAFVEVAGERRLIKEGVVTKGGALVLKPPRGVPADYFGPGNSEARIICGE